jgi:hypothetical protein
MSRTVNINQWIDIDVDLDEIDTDDLIEELKSRNVATPDGSPEDVTEMFYAFKLGNTERAMELAKKIACDHTGRIL